jgi:hypothetical protein
MNQIPVFISFDYQHDLETKNRLVTEWNTESCPIWIKDFSLPGAVADHRWQAEAAKRIDEVKAVLVLKQASWKRERLALDKFSF